MNIQTHTPHVVAWGIIVGYAVLGLALIFLAGYKLGLRDGRRAVAREIAREATAQERVGLIVVLLAVVLLVGCVGGGDPVKPCVPVLVIVVQRPDTLGQYTPLDSIYRRCE